MINSQNTLEAVFFIVLFIGAILMATVDTVGPVFAYIMSPPVFLIVLSFAGFTYIKKDKFLAGFGASLITVLYG